MVALRILRGARSCEGHLSIGEPVTVWRGPDRLPAAYCYRRGPDRWISLPGVAAFRFGPILGPVDAIPADGVSDARLEERYHRVVLPIVLQAFGHEVLHASAVVTAGGVVAFCGTSGTGKSTTVAALGLRGYLIAADDALLLSLDSARVSSAPLPFALRLLPQSAASLGLPEAGVDWPVRRARADHRPLRSIYLLERSSALEEEHSIETLEPHEAFRALLGQALCFSVHDRQRASTMLRNFMTVSAQVPVRRLRLRSGFAHLPRVLDELERSWR